MTLPQIIVDLMKLLFDMAVPTAICTMVLAGIALGQEGGVNFQAGGKFQRWTVWSVVLLTLPQFLSWFCPGLPHRAYQCRRRAGTSAVPGSQVSKAALPALSQTSWSAGLFRFSQLFAC
jgi:hypothetical protein